MSKYINTSKVEVKDSLRFPLCDSVLDVFEEAFDHAPETLAALIGDDHSSRLIRVWRDYVLYLV